MWTSQAPVVSELGTEKVPMRGPCMEKCSSQMVCHKDLYYLLRVNNIKCSDHVHECVYEDGSLAPKLNNEQ